ncbi:Syntaxin-124 [Citrus sinensis]|uniref:Syntaxin-124 n=1 Tax=Citrus sinensis TaxID=2711 RepID=A0ACB8N4Q9_CITSI|nr:Syntaxin-124 [Citrus sinensis]
MNDLISNSFKRYSNVDLEAGGVIRKGTENLDKFFDDVENVKEDMKVVEKLYKRLQESNEETKVAHNAKTMKQIRARMDSDVEQVLKRVKVIKGKLEALEKSNAANRKVPGCGPGSSVDRTRTSVVAGLGKKLKDTMDDFQHLRAKMTAEYKETIERRYFTVTGQQADEQMIENLISKQGRGQIMDTISEIQERHDAVKEIEKNLLELHQVFLDMFALVEAQGHQLNDIESHVAHANSFVRRGTEQLEFAKESQKDSRKWTCIAILLGIVLIIVFLFPLISTLIVNSPQ